MKKNGNIDFGLKLVLHWFYNVLNNKINDEILLIETKYFGTDLKIVKKYFSKFKQENYEIIIAKTDTSINELDNKKNYIILISNYTHTYYSMFNNLKRTVLRSFFYTIKKNLSEDSLLEKSKSFSTNPKFDIQFNINSYIFFLRYYYQPKKPEEILILLNFWQIRNYIFSIEKNTKKAFNFIDVLYDYDYIYKISKTELVKLEWEYIIKQDISYFKIYNILTSRLAILIYKIATFEFDASDTKIGRYYSKFLGIKSKTIRLPKKFYKVPNLIAKGYDLKESKKLNILKNEFLSQFKKR